jgi:SAM-dependent methyltransferase
MGPVPAENPGGTAAETPSGTVGPVQDRARSFDTVADLYDEMRPRYPDALFDDLLTLGQVPPGAQVLEIGTGPGVATRPLALRGLRIVGLEPGPALAAVARDNLAEFDAVEIRETTFEDAELAPASFDLVVSASAWHWVDQEVGPAKVARVLRPGGHLAVWWGHGSLAHDGIRDDSRAVHERWAPELAASRHAVPGPTTDDEGDDALGRRRRSQIRNALADQPWFEPVEQRAHPFEITYDADTYVRLLDTYSDYRLLDPEVRRHLFDELVAVIETNHGGRVTRRYSATLYLTRRNQLAAP